jgi:transcriptional regulator with XRE-family HTH domain
MTIIINKFGKYLKELRERKNFSIDYVAKKILVSRPTYTAIEKGGKDLTILQAKKIASLFDLTFEDFLAEKDTSIPGIKLEKIKKLEKKQIPEMRISIPQEKVEKFKEVLLYILERIGARPNIGEAVVCKLMYFIDFDYYEKFEEQLIGAKYIKNHFGPTPVAFPKIIALMEREGDLAHVTKKYFQHDQKKYLPLRSANLSHFSAQEKELIDWEIERFKNFNATKMRDYSHKDVPWIGANDLQPINYEAVFSRTDEFSVRQYDDEL